MVNCSLCMNRIVGPSIKHTCGKKFHEEHISSWLIFRNKICPVCHELFDKEQINDLKPQSDEEFEELKQYIYLLPESIDEKDPTKKKDYSLWILFPLIILMGLFAKYLSNTIIIVVFVVIFLAFPYYKMGKLKKNKEISE